MDRRSDREKALWGLVGPPLYYCADCLRAVEVKSEHEVLRPCGPECVTGIIAPRKAIVAGEGGLNWRDKAKVKYWQVAASLTGRCV